LSLIQEPTTKKRELKNNNSFKHIKIPFIKEQDQKKHLSVPFEKGLM